MEVSLHSNAQEREQFETMADLFSIFQATENLEKAYIRDAINADEYAPDRASFIRYTSTCTKLIAQYKTCISGLGPSFDVNEFIRSYEVVEALYP